ncbi:hypothetical protein Tgr7_3138 [Thioalkalivibrio sulfidiphilus HL-EbGr7]|uniref:Lipoprotein n=1 Tax=Thioalkalivibrio sulfidiphilus (strain HL-EbGR7) TaxID=396588 RepID=B8GQI3_THISH|nr:hypothetical protein [Thioalkalivibrio sulfidiphilus]ACL74207.1 hypothetical protein Tgr7_3138 [Thioalkalivibrio sulfidiphilus HL-EbGr7]
MMRYKVIAGSFLVLLLFACGSDRPDPANGSSWDRMYWDQGRWD